MNGRFAVVVGLDPGASNVGLVCWLSTAVGPVVLEGVTVEIVGAGPRAVTDMSLRAVATARAILVDHAATVAACAADAGQWVPAPLYFVENLVPPRRDSQQQRAVASSNKVQVAVMATAVSIGAILGALDGEVVEIVQPAGWDRRQGGPDVLRGRQPNGWRGRKGSERQHQRSAFFLSEQGLRASLDAGNAPPRLATEVPANAPAAAAAPAVDRPLSRAHPPPVKAAFCCIDAKYGLACGHGGGKAAAPTTAAVGVVRPVSQAPAVTRAAAVRTQVNASELYVDQLVELIRRCNPGTLAELSVATQDALAIVPVPEGQAPPDPAALAQLALAQYGVAPSLLT